jgi:hypothetical protein
MYEFYRYPATIPSTILTTKQWRRYAKVFSCAHVSLLMATDFFVARHRGLQGGAVHRSGLIGIGDGGGERGQRGSVEAIALRIDVRWGDLPLLSGRRVVIEDGPDWARGIIGWRQGGIHCHGCI